MIKLILGILAVICWAIGGLRLAGEAKVDWLQLGLAFAGAAVFIPL